jgi:hypothetical protein
MTASAGILFAKLEHSQTSVDFLQLIRVDDEK